MEDDRDEDARFHWLTISCFVGPQFSWRIPSSYKSLWKVKSFFFLSLFISFRSVFFSVSLQTSYRGWRKSCCRFTYWHLLPALLNLSHAKKNFMSKRAEKFSIFTCWWCLRFQLMHQTTLRLTVMCSRSLADIWMTVTR